MATSTHHHELHEGKALTNAAQTALENAGEQWTAMRASVFDTLSHFDKPASAYDIADAVSKAEGRRIAANSVYRILDLFVGANVAMRVESKNAYIANAHPGCMHDCIFLVCSGCGSATHVDDDKISDGLRAAARKVGFDPVRSVMEVQGKCAECD